MGSPIFRRVLPDHSRPGRSTRGADNLAYAAVLDPHGVHDVEGNFGERSADDRRSRQGGANQVASTGGTSRRIDDHECGPLLRTAELECDSRSVGNRRPFAPFPNDEVEVCAMAVHTTHCALDEIG